MTKTRSLILGVAGSVLFTGGAMAADPMPIVVAALPATTAPVAGPKVVIDISAGFSFGAGDSYAYLDANFGGLIDVRSASGWGARFDGGGYLNLLPGLYGSTGGTLTLYRALGELELGVFVGGGFSFPCCGGGWGAGMSANYRHESDNLYIRSETILQLLPFFDLESYTEMEYKLRDNMRLSAYLDYYGGFETGLGIDVDLTDRIEVWHNLYFGNWWLDTEVGAQFMLTSRFSVWGEVGFDFAPFAINDLDFGAKFELNDELSIKTAMDFDFAPFQFDWVETWLELDHQIGTGPLSLTAEAGVGFDGAVYAWGNIGIRYQLGVPADHDDNRLFGDGN